MTELSEINKYRPFKIWFISDTHACHSQLTVPKNIDLVIHSGDESNYWDQHRNHSEYQDFKEWYFNLPIKHKVFVPGNHSSYIFHNEKEVRKDFKKLGIHFLNKDSVEIEGLKLYGDPTTPIFGNWWHMSKREKLFNRWQLIPEDTDILITHGPPKRILDLSHNREGKLEYCGDQSLFNRVLEIKPKIHCFGHIHNSNGCYNQGERFYEGINFINASCVTDGKMGEITSNGIIKEI